LIFPFVPHEFDQLFFVFYSDVHEFCEERIFWDLVVLDPFNLAYERLEQLEMRQPLTLIIDLISDQLA
jgi:hypothetical protein